MATKGYTPLELARSAGFAIRRVRTGGAELREYVFDGQPCQMLELGPEATDLQIVRHAMRFLILPVSIRAADKDTPDTTQDCPICAS